MMRPPMYGPRGYGPPGYGGHEYGRPGPSPWIPATILGIILLITAMPYMKTPDAVVAYQAARTTSSYTRSFPLPLLWIPVAAVIALQFFGGHWPYSYGDVYGRPGMRGGPGGAMYGNGPGARYGYPGGVYGGGAAGMYGTRGFGPDRMGAAYNRGWGGWWPFSSPSWNPYNRYNTHQQRGLFSLFLDYGGHWLLILLGIALFTLVGSTSTLTVKPSLPVPLAPRRLGFPWRYLF